MFYTSSYINIFVSYFCNGKPLLSTYNFLNVYFISYLSDQKLNVKFVIFYEIFTLKPSAKPKVGPGMKLGCSKCSNVLCEFESTIFRAISTLNVLLGFRIIQFKPHNGRFCIGSTIDDTNFD